MTAATAKASKIAGMGRPSKAWNELYECSGSKSLSPMWVKKEPIENVMEAEARPSAIEAIETVVHMNEDLVTLTREFATRTISKMTPLS
ncbi:hypothetical protein QJS10_CPA07g00743 [Acorus calamus]|uniref:Uncharacterized protein n=1 Tax=Acorus calamus TaxID=4465 RepID=A0AAV9EGQ8_ACOCL|nr:hypothetical protein QJS10_CPA07g00743 [Acorus calamus]